MRYIAARHPERRYCVMDTATQEPVTDPIYSLHDAQDEAERMNEEMDQVLSDLHPEDYEDSDSLTEVEPDDFDDEDDDFDPAVEAAERDWYEDMSLDADDHPHAY